MATALLALVAAACNKPAQPSDVFTDAHARFIKLYARHGDEAFLDPEMVEIESQLRLVPSDSMDAASAQELLERIRKGRAQETAKRKEIEQTVARATAPPPAPSEREAERAPFPRQLEIPPARARNEPPAPAPPQEEPKPPDPQVRFTNDAAEEARQEEAYWRGRFREAQSRIAQIQARINEVQRGREINGMPVTASQSIGCPPGSPTCTRYEYNEGTQRSGLEQLTKMLSQAESALADLEREASSRSVPREWRR